MHKNRIKSFIAMVLNINLIRYEKGFSLNISEFILRICEFSYSFKKKMFTLHIVVKQRIWN